MTAFDQTAWVSQSKGWKDIPPRVTISCLHGRLHWACRNCLTDLAHLPTHSSGLHPPAAYPNSLWEGSRQFWIFQQGGALNNSAKCGHSPGEHAGLRKNWVFSPMKIRNGQEISKMREKSAEDARPMESTVAIWAGMAQRKGESTDVPRSWEFGPAPKPSHLGKHGDQRQIESLMGRCLPIQQLNLGGPALFEPSRWSNTNFGPPAASPSPTPTAVPQLAPLLAQFTFTPGPSNDIFFTYFLDVVSIWRPRLPKQESVGTGLASQRIQVTTDDEVRTTTIWLKHSVLWHSSRGPGGYARWHGVGICPVHSWHAADWDYGQKTLAFLCTTILASEILNTASCKAFPSALAREDTPPHSKSSGKGAFTLAAGSHLPLLINLLFLLAVTKSTEKAVRKR
ncbi:hypothetical protein B0H17DRAFT_1140364 [Mycena rosella]|uniref:Uncharacterized protein n=1 Tax=Mycena rosella TaxID=1033263 RepID=A0AAD7D241_MYCRO|nr:hypothetical protein B0H17DRAFT_1140364 [Mycena rosella]